MNSPSNLKDTVQTLNADDALRLRYSRDDWRLFEAYLQPFQLRAGDVLIRHLDMDRSLYLLESGTLQVYVPVSATTAAGGRRPVAILRPGAVVGEPSLFGDTHMYGPEGVNFYTRTKVVTSRWPDPRTSTVDLGFPQNR